MKYIRLICIICVALVSIEGFAQGKITRPTKTQHQPSAAAKQKSTTGTINGHEWVDLGLPSRVKWATCNVGASSPSDYGNYYAWGETTTKSEYIKNNSKTYGKSIDNISDNAQYDAARANWGDSWRLPTKTECEELKNKCTWSWTTQDGHKGYKVTGPNGKSIFLPAAGFRHITSLYDTGDNGYYWSSTTDDKKDFGNASYFAFSTKDKFIGRGSCQYGFSLRPVLR